MPGEVLSTGMMHNEEFMQPPLPQNQVHFGTIRTMLKSWVSLNSLLIKDCYFEVVRWLVVKVVSPRALFPLPLHYAAFLICLIGVQIRMLQFLSTKLLPLSCLLLNDGDAGLYG